MSKTDKDRHGFTLLEIMVSISILALVLVSLFRMQSTSVQLAGSLKFYATASLLARMKIAETEAALRKGDGGELPPSGDFGESYQGYMWHRIVRQMPESALGNLDSLSGTIKDDLTKHFKKIDIEILFMDQYSFSVTVWRFVELGY